MKRISQKILSDKCHRCYREGLGYEVIMLGSHGQQLRTLCIYHFCSMCIHQVRKDHPHNVYIPFGITSTERELMIASKIKEFEN